MNGWRWIYEISGRPWQEQSVGASTVASLHDPNWEAFDREAVRADRFLSHAEPARKQALWYGDAKFFAKVAYQKAFLTQVRYLRGIQPEEAVFSLRQAVCAFATALELGYPTEAVEINNWFYRSLVVNDNSLAQFLVALPGEIWPYGDAFPRWVACWGFALFRGQNQRASQILELLYGLCFEADGPPKDGEEQQARQLQENSYYLMEAILKQDSSSATTFLHKRIELRPIVPPEGTRYELFHPLDLIGLGFCRLARMRGMTVKIAHPSLPLALLDAATSEVGSSKNRS